MFRSIRNRLPQIPYKIDHADSLAIPTVRDLLYETLQRGKSEQQDLVIVCIGTDRSTGDSLGPLVGTFLKRSLHHSVIHQNQNVYVYGTLDQPVHAVNLQETIAAIQKNHNRPFILAIDACLGKLANVGTIQLAHGPLKPGAGVNKELPEIGDMHITGIVNVGGFMEYFVLQNTRLHLVMSMAECISNIIKETMLLNYKQKLSTFYIQSENPSLYMQ
ncbi:spore protease YyaC [Fodinisporobacter ferrooxydans]|uniref:Spore protease YyaC n=1 Tax=Fodinisporobacter ferrooxydans TaxID=2901836 RepID=A0ABY4CR98_9BACL|nr:spore protease YyaC [Alicyclobacillaceae bacterium MYW30-H2]